MMNRSTYGAGGGVAQRRNIPYDMVGGRMNRTSNWYLLLSVPFLETRIVVNYIVVLLS
jgi:hypothetical protein